jgi:hypothetical protein
MRWSRHCGGRDTAVVATLRWSSPGVPLDINTNGMIHNNLDGQSFCGDLCPLRLVWFKLEGSLHLYLFGKYELC